MDPKHHAWLARKLIDACGGLPEAALHCRLEKSRLSEFQQPGAGAFMRADVIDDLEAYCGEPIYSRALLEARPGYVETAGLVSEACATVEIAAALQKLVRRVTAGGKLTRRERDEIAEDIGALEGQLRALRASSEGGAS